MTIDPTTGLPQLPEGYSWNIGQYKFEIKGPVRAGNWIVCYNTPEHYMWHRNRETKRELVIKTKQGIFGTKNKTVSVQYCRSKTASKVVWSKEYGIESITHYNTFRTPEDIYRDMANGRQTDKRNIIGRCYETLDEYNAYKERNALYGEYPPKKLEVTDG